MVGITIGSSEIKIGQYADDTFLIIDGSKGSIRKALQILTHFEKISGLRINVDKTQVIKLGTEYKDQICPILNIPYSRTFKLLGIQFSSNLEEMEDINFTSKISNIRRIIRMYQWRNLTMAGRITIVKMQILPNLIHLLSVLPSPRKQRMTELNNILTQFIWDNRSPKIQLNTLVQDYKMGGQKMLHFSSFCKASKLSWVKRLYNTPETNSWIVIAKEIFKEKYIPFIFEGAVKCTQNMVRQLKNQFWKEVLNTWVFYREKIETLSEKNTIPHTVIWNSGLIGNNNLLIRRNMFMSKGLLYLKDLYNYNTQEFKTRQQLHDLHNINISAFDHMCLIQSIPPRHKNIIINMINCNSHFDNGNTNLVRKICSKQKLLRYTYLAMIRKLPFEIKAIPKWEYLFSTRIEQLKWQNIFTLPKQITIDSQTRIFQYKIIHRILPTNSLLHKYKLKTDPFCDLCHNIIDTLEHTFHLCPRILQLWYDIATWLFPEIDLFQYINSENIILGVYTEKLILENTLILSIKRYIYINKCKETQITLIGIKLFLRHIMILETSIKNENAKVKNVFKWATIVHKIQAA